MQKGDPSEVARLASGVNNLRARLGTASQAQEKAKASMASLGELLAAVNHDLKMAIERSKAYFDKASTLEIKKSQLQEKVSTLEAEQASWAQTKASLEQRAFSLKLTFTEKEK